MGSDRCVATAILMRCSQSFFGGWPALPTDRLVSDEIASVVNTEIQYCIHVAKYSHLVNLLEQRFFSSPRPLASFLDFGSHRSFKADEIYRLDSAAYFIL